MSQYSSQTESEPEGSFSGWDAAELPAMSTEIGRIGRISSPSQTDIVELTDALAMLKNMDICAVAEDDSLHETIREISSTILLYLDRLEDESDEGSWQDTRLTLLALLDADILSLLFKYRALFRSIAATRTIEASTAVIVCWPDIILAKLGQAIVSVAGPCFDMSPSDHTCPQFVRAQREDDILRAAVQLPEQWSDIMQVITSDYISPAAYRLGLCLVFGIHVMVPQLSVGNTAVDRAERDRLLRMLQARLKHFVSKRNQGAMITLLDAGEQERISFAMFVSLYAVADSDGHHGLGSPGRPQSQAVLLEMVQAVLRPDPLLSPLSIVTPPSEVDTATIILVRWGATLPWAWRTWEDARLYNSEVIEHLTVTWLHKLDVLPDEALLAHSVEYWDPSLVIALETGPRAALSMMLRLLLCALCAVKDVTPGQLPKSALDVTLKICWSTKHLMPLVEVDHASSTALLGITCNMFAMLSDGITELGIKDLLIEILSMSKTGLQGAVTVVPDAKSEFTTNVDRKLNQYSCDLCSGLHETLTFEDIRAVKQLLQLLTLLWTSGTSPRSIPQSTQRFLSSLAVWLKSVHIDSPAWRILGDAFVGIITILEQRRADSTFATIDRCWDELSICRVAREADPSEFPLASSFALYVVTMAHLWHGDPLFCAEAWDYLRDVLLLILTGDHEGPDEPLALLIAPSICRALIALLNNATGASLDYHTSSPWTVCMVTNLKRLTDCESSHTEYAQILYDRIGPQARLLRRALTNHYVEPSTSSGMREVQVRLFTI